MERAPPAGEGTLWYAEEDVEQTYFQRGFSLKQAVAPVLAKSYDSATVDRLKEMGYLARAGELSFRLAREFGFCYGVERAVDYAYQARQHFPDRRIFLSGEIIHNPDVNRRIEDLGIRILRGEGDPESRYQEVREGDVVILPAFGVAIAEMEHLRARRCVLVDTTCGSVLNVWKNVRRYAREGFTAVIHGKHFHEETRATASQALTHPGGQYLCVRNADEASAVCEFIRGETPADALLARFRHAASPEFDPERDLGRIGLANQTTMLMRESLAIQEMFSAAMTERYGASELAGRLRAFDTICSATQERQDAVIQMLAEGGLDLMVVIGGYNSSNTQALTRICAEKVPTFHIARPDCITADGILHLPAGSGGEVRSEAWLPRGSVRIGLTAGASTPNSVVGEVIRRLLALRGLEPSSLGPA
jgi:4-hydroxy-3-methylbut-2-enyl diphosphate reductase